MESSNQAKTFSKRREFLFIYSVKDANPNGDPLNANHPRYDEETGQCMVSDVRVKRTIRDQWLREGKDIFVSGEAVTLPNRIKALREKFNLNDKKENKVALQNCIDVRLFGVTAAEGDASFAWTGPVQFKWGRSLHKVKPELVQGTGAFATKDGSEQRTFRNEYLIPFSLIAVYAIANQHAAGQTGATEQDVEDLKSAFWSGTTNLITRSKVGHVPRMILEIVYKEGFDGAICALDEKVSLKNMAGDLLTENEQYALRSMKECFIDTSLLQKVLEKKASDIETVNIWHNEDVQVEIKGNNIKIKEM